MSNIRSVIKNIQDIMRKAAGLVGGVAGAASGLGFGSPIQSVQVCECNLAYLWTLGGPTPGTYLFQPGVSTLMANFQVSKPGVFVLGTWKGIGECIKPVCQGQCCVVGTGNLVEVVGTSL